MDPHLVYIWLQDQNAGELVSRILVRNCMHSCLQLVSPPDQAIQRKKNVPSHLYSTGFEEFYKQSFTFHAGWTREIFQKSQGIQSFCFEASFCLGLAQEWVLGHIIIVLCQLLYLQTPYQSSRIQLIQNYYQ